MARLGAQQPAEQVGQVFDGLIDQFRDTGSAEEVVDRVGRPIHRAGDPSVAPSTTSSTVSVVSFTTSLRPPTVSSAPIPPPEDRPSHRLLRSRVALHPALIRAGARDVGMRTGPSPGSVRTDPAASGVSLLQGDRGPGWVPPSRPAPEARASAFGARRAGQGRPATPTTTAAVVPVAAAAN